LDATDSSSIDICWYWCYYFSISIDADEYLTNDDDDMTNDDSGTFFTKTGSRWYDVEKYKRTAAADRKSASVRTNDDSDMKKIIDSAVYALELHNKSHYGWPPEMFNKWFYSDDRFNRQVQTWANFRGTEREKLENEVMIVLRAAGVIND
jgi:hypothetical protein